MRTTVILVFVSTLAVPIANIAQARNGAIVGRVVTAEGMPAAEVRVSAMPLPNDKGIASTGAAAAGVTDIEGRYRISNLPAGRYAVLPNIGNDPSLTLRQTYAAPAIVVRPGAETPRDISLEPQGRVTISGRVNQELMPRNARTVSLGSVDKVLQARVATDGSFSFTGVPKGTYRLSLPVPTFAWKARRH